MRDTSNLPDANPFKPATTPEQAATIFTYQLQTYSEFTDALATPVLGENFTGDTLFQVTSKISTLIDYLRSWLALPSVK